MAKSSFPLYPDPDKSSVSCSVSLPLRVRDDLTDLASYIMVSRSSLVTCLLAPQLQAILQMLRERPELIDRVLAEAGSSGGERLRGEAGQCVEHKVLLLSHYLRGVKK